MCDDEPIPPFRSLGDCWRAKNTKNKPPRVTHEAAAMKSVVCCILNGHRQHADSVGGCVRVCLWQPLTRRFRHFHDRLYVCMYARERNAALALPISELRPPPAL